MISPMSTKAKINNFAREKSIPMQVAWQNYIFERFLEPTLKLSPNLLFCVPRELLADKPYKTGDVIRVQSLRHTKEGLIIREADKIKRKDIER